MEEPTHLSDSFDVFKKQPKYMGFVYVLHCKGCFKIGYTGGSVNKRVSSMATGNPFEIDVALLIGYKSIQGAQCSERQLHQKYMGKKIKGEWFSLCWDHIRALAFNNKDMVVLDNINLLDIESKTFNIGFQRTPNKGPRNMVMSGLGFYEQPMFQHIVSVKDQELKELSSPDLHWLIMKLNEYLEKIKPGN